MYVCMYSILLTCTCIFLFFVYVLNFLSIQSLCTGTGGYRYRVLHDGRVQVNYGIREWRNVLILADVVVVTTYVNVHRCQEVDGRVQVLMVERPSSLKLRNKQQVHVCRNYGSDQYIKNYYTMCHPMMERLFNELKQSTMRKSSSRKKVLFLSRRNSSTPVTCALMPH